MLRSERSPGTTAVHDKKGMKRLCVQWPRFGPYHLARLEATHRYAQQQGAELIGLETAGRDATYAWRPERGATAFHREQVFPDRTFEALTPREMHAGVTAALNRLQPDAVAVNSYSLPDARACLAWCRRHRRVAVLMTDSKADDAPRRAWREQLKRCIVSQYDAALVAGTPHRRYVAALGIPEGHIFLGYDVVDNDFFRRKAAAVRHNPRAFHDLPGLGGDAPFFLAVSRFIRRKDLPTLLQAYNLYRTRAPVPWRLILLGDGPERPRLETLIREKGIEGITLAGFRHLEETAAYYGLAGAFIHPARVDQWGLVVNEAMATGLPVLVSEGAGCAENLVEEGGNGFRFAPGDMAHLAYLMQHLAHGEADREAMGRRSQERIAAWSPEHFARQLWRAAAAGRARADRPLGTAAHVLLWALRISARDAQSFHSVEA